MELRDSCTPAWVQVHEPSHTQKCPRASYQQHPMRLIPNSRTNDLYLANKHRSVGDEEEAWLHCAPFYCVLCGRKNHPLQDLFGSEVSQSNNVDTTIARLGTRQVANTRCLRTESRFNYGNEHQETR